MHCVLSGGSYIYVGGVGVVVFTIHSSSYRLQNNTMTIIYISVREATSLNTLATKILDSQAVMFLN